MCICEKCKKEHDGKFGSGRFCSRPCSNSHKRSDESKQKTSLALKGKTREFWKRRPLTEEELSKWKENQRKSWERKYHNATFEELGWEGKRRRVKEEQNNRCAKCSLNEWMGVSLTLEIDHIDGNGNNNSRENLVGLCPNCHSITDTWRGRNKASKNGNALVSDEELLEHLQTKNIRQSLLAVGLAAKGGNYNRARILLATIDKERASEYRSSRR